MNILYKELSVAIDNEKWSYGFRLMLYCTVQDKAQAQKSVCNNGLKESQSGPVANLKSLKSNFLS